VCPFVGLIIGTYGRNPTSQSVMRWFHVTKKGVSTQNLSSQERGNIGVQKGKGDDNTKGVNFPMNLHVTHRKYRKLNKKSCLQDCESVAKMRLKLTTSGESIRLKSDVNTLKSILMQKSQKSSKPKNKILTSNTAEWYLCREINLSNKPVIGIPANRSTSNQQKCESVTNQCRS